jgi:hypothetical protein
MRGFVINDPMVIAAEQEQVFHRIDVVRQRRSLGSRSLVTNAHYVGSLSERDGLFPGSDLIGDRVQATREGTLVARECEQPVCDGVWNILANARRHGTA